MDEGKQKENDFKEQLEKRNALLIRTLEKLATAEDEIQSLEHERQALQEETKILRNSRSGLSKECTNQEKTISTMKKEGQRLRHRIEELENMVEDLKKDVLDLKGHMSTIKAIECGSDEAGRMSLTDTLDTRHFEKENADLVEKTKTLTKENESFKTECKQLREEGEQLKSILKIFQETRIESDKALLSRFSKQKECKSPDKTMLIIEMDKQQLRDKIVQLEIEVKSLREIVINLEEKMSTINAVECELDETGRMRQLEQENADLMERTKTLTKENQSFKKETKHLEEERKHFESIIKIFQHTGMESDKALLSRILKGCKTHEKSLSILEKERQQLRDTIVELGNEVEVLNEEIIDLKDYESTIEAAKCANNTAEKKRLTYETRHNRRLKKKNAVLKKTMKTLTNENENYRIETTKLQREREYVKRIIKIFQETRIESDTALLRKYFTPRDNYILITCIHIDERITIAHALKHEPNKAFIINCSPFDCNFPPTILFDHNMKVCQIGRAAEKQYSALREEELEQFHLFRLTCSEKSAFLGHEHWDVAKKTRLDVVRLYQELIHYLGSIVKEYFSLIPPKAITWSLIVPRQWGIAGHEFMTEAAIKAGIEQDTIVTVFAPLAYIAYAEIMDKGTREEHLLKPGMNILLIEARETVHITVYQRKRGGGLREVLPPHILHCGQSLFAKILVEIVGPQVWAEFCDKAPEDLLDLQRTISSRMRQHGEVPLIRFSVPVSLKEIFLKYTGTSIGEYVKTSIYSESVEFPGIHDKITVKPSLFVDRCADVLMGFQKTLVTTSFVSGDMVLLLVGGFAQYKPFQEAVKLAFPHHRVIIPDHEEHVVEKGGALIGQNVHNCSDYK
ncbi:uncharacterized protein LOC128245373 isoform X2 [Mya arenaria]|uniref:uncharacterized protein LOC128245373 isoform X2 n=1 Tax=Mya arenaria TaxID=6604 RepID=UPI0022E6429D|nr:uncharacterized protein LOC128245373 isoform X2 [Mya arenaria]